MPVRNLHTRAIAANADTVGALIDTLGARDDRLWPVEHWPRMRLDRPLDPGAAGGHGPIRYHVVEYLPGERVRFRFTGPRGFSGFHEFSVYGRGDHDAELCHLLVLRPHGPARLTWPLLYRWLHDALIEDALDRAERGLAGTVAEPARWNGYVRLVRAVLAR